MPIIFGGTTVEKVVFGGTEVDKVVFNGVTVFEKMPQLATPQNVTADGTNVSWDEVENATSYEVIEGGNNVLGTYTPVTLISFNIRNTDNTTTIYQAEEKMTWAQWVASSYNTAGFRISNDGVNVESSGSGANLVCNNSNNAAVTVTEIIENGDAYYVGLPQ